MIEETLRVLEYDKVRSLLAGFTVTGPGRELAVNMAPLASREEIVASLEEVGEMVGLLNGSGPPPVGGARDLAPMLQELRAEGSLVLPQDLLEVLASAEAAEDSRRFFSHCQVAPRLAERASALVPLKELRQEIRHSIGTRGDILDSASFELGEIRRDLQQIRGRIKKALEDLLATEQNSGAFQDRIITERNGRYVVPVRADHRGQIKGFVQDESASGQTLYLEPAAVLKLNNELQSLQRQEKREEEKILRRLAERVRRDSVALLQNQEILALLDFRGAAGRLAVQSRSVAPFLADEPVIELKDARHPLLLFHPDGRVREQRIVPVDILLEQGRDTLVISGPNTGGKTVALKTAGLLLLMARSGLPIPCHSDSRLHLFGKVFADIGDEQSIEQNLSTFSGHLTRIRRILESADGDSLVLLDEAGTGTDPAEGGALALAVLDTLRERGARTILTTHLNLIKGYAHLQAGVENAAVEFDGRTLEPTYRLHYGIPGASSAFTIAQLLGMPGEVLDRANSYLGEGERQGLELVEKLHRLQEDLQRQLTEAAVARDQARHDRARRKQLLEEIEEQKRVLLDRAARQGEELVREAERKIRDLLHQAREAAARPPEAARIAGEVRQVREGLDKARARTRSVGAPPKEAAAGEILRVPALGSDATVIRQVGQEVELDLFGKRLRMPLSALEQYSPRRFAGKRKARGVVSGRVERDGFSPRLLLVGRRAEEALLLLDRFLDDALLHGQKEVEVVHGAGTGVLRKTVRDFLAGHREVVAFHAADLAQGGENITVVELKG